MLIRQVTVAKLQLALEMQNRRWATVAVLYAEVPKTCEIASQLGWKLVQAWCQVNLPVPGDIPHTSLLFFRDPR